jgi:hypothetical protein
MREYLIWEVSCPYFQAVAVLETGDETSSFIAQFHFSVS